VWRSSQQIGVSASNAWEICRDDLSLFLYKTQLSLPLPEEGIVEMLWLWDGALLEDSPGVFYVTWFSDGARFYLDGYIIKKTFS
jgi:hypothetical protein